MCTSMTCKIVKALFQSFINISFTFIWPSPASIVLFKKLVTIITVDFIAIYAWIVGVEGENVHTTAQL